MSDKNLLIGDTTYPHTPITLKMIPSAQSTVVLPSRVVDALHDRIEQLERKLADAQKDAERYRFLNYLGCIFDIDGEEYKVCEFRMNDVIDAAIQDGK
jgi:hypothetical protein